MITRSYYESRSDENKKIIDIMTLGDILLVKFDLKQNVDMRCEELPDNVAGRHCIHFHQDYNNKVYTTETIIINRNKMDIISEVVNVLLHEIAHALVYKIFKETGHGDNFELIAKAIGCKI